MASLQFYRLWIFAHSQNLNATAYGQNAEVALEGFQTDRHNLLVIRKINVEQIK